MISINDIRNAVDHYGTQLGIPSGTLKVFDSPQGDGSSYIQIKGDTFSYIIEERGCIFEERKTSDINTLLYWLMNDVISTIANDYELKHRDASRDSRRILFSKELQLMKSLEQSWYLQKKKEIDNTLANSPYSDK
jgi:hypothetical protein